MNPKTYPKVCVVIPCFKVKDSILDVISQLDSMVQRIIVVDDFCPDRTGIFVEENTVDPRVKVIYNEANLGVGGSTINGYRCGLEEGYEILVKVDGDGQMDGRRIPELIEPLVNGRADYSKGNRFFNLKYLKGMPKVRIIGNIALSFLSKASSGYWFLFDPNNGFTAIKSEVLANLPLDSISRRYFFESDMLFRLNMEYARVAEIRMPAIYGDERSNLNVLKAVFEFSIKHLRNFIKRLIYTYLLRDFSVASINLIIGSILLLFSIVLGSYAWIHGITSSAQTSTGTQVLVAISFLGGLQMILSFLNHDITRSSELKESREM